MAISAALGSSAHAEPPSTPGVALAARIVRGVVTGVKSTTPIANVTVFNDAGAVASTDIDGYFAIEVTPTARELTFVGAGYVTLTAPIRDGVFHVELVRDATAEVIEVVGRAPDGAKALSYSLTADEVKNIPGAGDDVLRAAQALPGVSRIPFSFGGLVLRGSSPRDTSVFLDGIEVPFAFHFGGIASFYPSQMLSDLSIQNGNFDSSYGRTEGGLVTLTTREPRIDKWREGGQVGLLDSGAWAEGPLPDGGGVIVGVRRSYLDAVAAPFVDADTPLPSYWDAQLRTSWGTPKDSGRITPEAFLSIDSIASPKLQATAAFVRVAAPYTKQWGDLTLRLVPWVGWTNVSFTNTDDDGKVTTFARPSYPGGLRADVTQDASWGQLAGGLEYDAGHLEATQFGVGTGNHVMGDLPDGSSTVNWSDIALWVSSRFDLGKRFQIRPGVRVESYLTTGELVFDPRLNTHIQLTDRLAFRQGLGRYHQPPAPADTDKISGNPQLKSSYYDQASVGFDAAIATGLSASLTGYYSYGRNIAVAANDPAFPGHPPIQPDFGGLGPTFQELLEKELGASQYEDNSGRAKNYGVELSIRYSNETWFAMVSYTLASSQRTDSPAASVGWHPYELDQLNNLNVVGSYRYKRWQFGGRLQLVSGNPYSPVVVNAAGNEITEAWAGTLPMFFQLDLRIDHRWYPHYGTVDLYFDIQNVTNYHNVEGREFDEGTGKEVDTYGLPIIPFIGVELIPKS